MTDTALAALVRIAPRASSELGADIDELIPLLMRYRRASLSAMLRDLESPA